LRVSPPHQPWLAKPTWNGVLSSSWWNRSMCGPLLMLESHLYRYTIRDNGTNGRIRIARMCTRYGRDRGESGESTVSCHVLFGISVLHTVHKLVSRTRQAIE